MGTFRSRVVEIEALRFGGSEEDAVGIIAWAASYGAVITQVKSKFPPFEMSLMVPTMEGNMIARPGWWVIKGLKDEFYPCDAEVFEAKYELVEPEVDNG